MLRPELAPVHVVEIVGAAASGKLYGARALVQVVAHGRNAPVEIAGHVAVGIVGIFFILIGSVNEVVRTIIDRIIGTVGDARHPVATVFIFHVVNGAVLRAVGRPETVAQ